MKTKRFYKIASVIIAVTMMCTPLTMLPVSAATSDSVSASEEFHATKSDIETAIFSITSICGANWTDESLAVFEKALVKAQSVIDNPNATQEEIDTAYKEINDAAAQLETYNWNTNDLWNAIQKADALDKTLYTEESFKNVHIALNLAYPTLNYARSQEEVDNATKQLNDAINGLVTLEDDNILTLVDKYYADNYSQRTLTDFPPTTSAPSKVSYNGFRLVNTTLPFCSPMINTFNIKGYTFELDNIYEPSHLEYLAVNPNTQEVLPLETALRNGKIDINEMVENNVGFFNYAKMNLTGDADFDGKLTIKDVTTMQKILAGIQEKTDKYINKDTFYDIDSDKRFSIADATYLQKQLVIK